MLYEHLPIIGYIYSYLLRKRFFKTFIPEHYKPNAPQPALKVVVI